jgi:hypothetical protein
MATKTFEKQNPPVHPEHYKDEFRGTSAPEADRVETRVRGASDSPMFPFKPWGCSC